MTDRRAIEEVIAATIGYTPPTDGVLGSGLSKMMAFHQATEIVDALVAADCLIVSRCPNQALHWVEGDDERGLDVECNLCYHESGIIVGGRPTPEQVAAVFGGSDD